MQLESLPRELHRAGNGSAEAARADTLVAHGRAHLDYQRRIATAGIHRNNARMMPPLPRVLTAAEFERSIREARPGFHLPKDAA